MNKLYPFVEQAFRSGSQQSLSRLLEELVREPGEKSEVLGLPVNWEYTLKRLLGTLLAREPELKFNAFLTLSALAPHLGRPHSEALYEYIARLSDYKKHCEGKAIDIEAYVVGKILIFKALRSLFGGHLNAMNHLVGVLTAFPAFEEQLVELLGQLATDKKSTLLFLKLTPTTKAGFVLHTILRAQLKGIVPELNGNVVTDVLGELVAVYPKRSICLDYLGPQLKHFLAEPSQFLSEQLAGIFEGDSEVNVRVLFYLLQLLEGHLRGAKVTAENVWNLLSVKVLGGWILQLKVKNKHIRKIAESITVDFDKDPVLAFKVLSELHDKQLYLENINHKHPLYCLYEHVEPHNYAKYLLGLIAQQVAQGEEKPQQKGFFNELEVFLVARHKELTIEEICQIITVFVNRYHQASDQAALQALNTIFNALLSSNPKKTQVLHARPSLILAKLNYDQLELGEHQAEVRQAVKLIRGRFKAGKEESDPFNITYYNFLLAVGFYFLVFPEDVEVFADLEVVEKELKNSILNSESGQAKKKRKQSEADKNKPVHVLVEALISLLTKSSQFLRTAINLVFEQVVPFLDSADIANLLEVVTKPDSELLAGEAPQ